MHEIPTRHFKVRSSDVVSEVIDGEAVIMDLRTGYYYSARQEAAGVWEALVSGHSDTAILNRLRAEFDADADYLRQQLDLYIETLMRHALIVVDSAGCETSDGSPASIPPGQRPFPPLVLEAFQDMEELLLLDPIHEVEEEFGWPVKKPEDRP